jgi:hypothetical protein
MQDRVKHPARPLDVPSGQLSNAFEDRIAVAVLVGEDGEDEGGGGGGDEILVYFHAVTGAIAEDTGVT